jgi:hypothetical protein
MVQLWGSESAADYSARSNLLYKMRQELFPNVRRMASLYQRNDLQGLSRAMTTAAFSDVEGADQLHPVYKLGRMYDILFAPLMRQGPYQMALQEVYSPMNECRRQMRPAYMQLMDSFSTNLAFLEYRRKVVATATGVIEDVGAVLPGMAWERISPPRSATDFRILRDDFDVLRSRYVEIYELATRCLVYIGAIANVARRGSPSRWSDGSDRTPQRLLKETAQRREFIVLEFPALKHLYDSVHRTSRNQFGHYAVEYDVGSGELVDYKGHRTNYVLFLADYLEAARLIKTLLTIVEKITLDQLDSDSTTGTT